MRSSFRPPVPALPGLVLAALLAAVGAASATPVVQTYTTVLRPVSGGPVDRLEIAWSTARATGTATEADLVRLEFRLFAAGSFLLIVKDQAILGAAVQSLGDIGRSLGDLDFAFDLDAFDLDRSAGLLAFDNDGGGVAPFAAGGGVLDASGSGAFAAVAVWNGGSDQGAWSGETSAITTLPVPAALPLMAGGLALLGIAGARRRAAG